MIMYLLALTLELLPTLDSRMMNQMVQKTATRTTTMNLMMMGIVIIIYLALIVDTRSITHDTGTGLHMAPPVTKQTVDKRKNGTKNKHKQGKTTYF
jgi:hypothetical protein